MLRSARKSSSSLQTLQRNSVPLRFTNINCPSALSDMPPSTKIQRPWRESSTNVHGEGVTLVDF